MKDIVMREYSSEIKEAMVAKLCSPGGPTLERLSEETGISRASLYNWRRAGRGGKSLSKKNRRAKDWSPQERLEAVFEASNLNEHDLVVVTFPVPMRYWLGSNRKLYTKIHKLVMDKIHGYYKSKAKDTGIKDPLPGAVSYSQRWGSALNLNPHMHVLCLDGVYTLVNDKPVFRKLPAITDDEVSILLDSISKRIMKFLKRKGYLDKHGDVVSHPHLDELFEESDLLRQATSSSITSRIAFGPNAGKKVTKIGGGFGYLEEIALLKGKRCASIHGFSLHANTHIKTQDRKGLEKLIRYIARGPLANERLSLTKRDNTQIVSLKLKRPFSDGTTHVLFTPLEFIEKLVAITPPPRTHLVRWSGVFASASKVRRKVVLNPDAKKGFDFKKCSEKSGGDSETKEVKEVKNYSWARMLKRVFKIDVSKCKGCKSEMLHVSAVIKPSQVKRYLHSQGLESLPPQRAPPRSNQLTLAFP